MIDPDCNGGQVPVRLWHDQLFSKPPKHGGVVAWSEMIPLFLFPLFAILLIGIKITAIGLGLNQ